MSVNRFSASGSGIDEVVVDMGAQYITKDVAKADSSIYEKLVRNKIIIPFAGEIRNERTKGVGGA